jgi:hypothetical protein
MMIDINHVELLIMIMVAKDLYNVLLHVKHVEHNLNDVNVVYLLLLLIMLQVMKQYHQLYLVLNIMFQNVEQEKHKDFLV